MEGVEVLERADHQHRRHDGDGRNDQRPRAHARWRAHQNTTTDAPQKPEPMNAALIGLAIVHEKNWSVCSERMNSCVPAKKVSAVST